MIETCSQCAKKFSCGIDAQQCWCNQYPAVLIIAEGDTCLCNKCMHNAVAEKVQQIENEMTPENALQNNWMKDLPKSKHVKEGIDYYVEKDLYVFTKWHHLKRGYCCKNNCRHCAYGFQKEMVK
jgi:Family of unknown function (DUF5522)